MNLNETVVKKYLQEKNFNVYRLSVISSQYVEIPEEERLWMKEMYHENHGGDMKVGVPGENIVEKGVPDFYAFKKTSEGKQRWFVEAKSIGTGLSESQVNWQRKHNYFDSKIIITHKNGVVADAELNMESVALPVPKVVNSDKIDMQSIY